VECVTEESLFDVSRTNSEIRLINGLVEIGGEKHENSGKGNGERADGLIEPMDGIGNIRSFLKDVIKPPRFLYNASEQGAMGFVEARDVSNRALQEARGGTHGSEDSHIERSEGHGHKLQEKKSTEIDEGVDGSQAEGTSGTRVVGNNGSYGKRSCILGEGRKVRDTANDGIAAINGILQEPIQGLSVLQRG
jgi:hypothetical protein